MCRVSYNNTWDCPCNVPQNRGYVTPCFVARHSKGALLVAKFATDLRENPQQQQQDDKEVPPCYEPTTLAEAGTGEWCLNGLRRQHAEQLSRPKAESLETASGEGQQLLRQCPRCEGMYEKVLHGLWFSEMQMVTRHMGLQEWHRELLQRPAEEVAKIPDLDDLAEPMVDLAAAAGADADEVYEDTYVRFSVVMAERCVQRAWEVHHMWKFQNGGDDEEGARLMLAGRHINSPLPTEGYGRLLCAPVWRMEATGKADLEAVHKVLIQAMDILADPSVAIDI